jgi:cation transport regulator ChaC
LDREAFAATDSMMPSRRRNVSTPSTLLTDDDHFLCVLWIRTTARFRPLPSNPHSRRYVGSLTDEEITAVISSARGYAGTSADYLRETVAHFDELGLRDEALTRVGLPCKRESRECRQFSPDSVPRTILGCKLQP